MLYVHVTYGRTQKKFRGGELESWEPRVRMRLPFSIPFESFGDLLTACISYLEKINTKQARKASQTNKILWF